jgi:GGDEF domain-containing protein
MGTAFLLTLACALTFRLIMERSEQKLRILSLTDTLTGVLNRRGLFAQFTRIQTKAFDDQAAGRGAAVRSR